VPFHEYFHGDTGAGVGASHQTGWTALVAKMIDELFMKQKQVGRITAAVARAS
jgi:cyanophycinase-like exopeptidase